LPHFSLLFCCFSLLMRLLFFTLSF
jgi:hypothetical protein